MKEICDITVLAPQDPRRSLETCRLILGRLLDRLLGHLGLLVLDGLVGHLAHPLDPLAHRLDRHLAHLPCDGRLLVQRAQSENGQGEDGRPEPVKEKSLITTVCHFNPPVNVIQRSRAHAHFSVIVETMALSPWQVSIFLSQCLHLVLH